MNSTISLTVLLDDEASVAEARGDAYGEISKGTVKGKGSSKKHPKDAPDALVGYNLAVARALRSLADQYEKRADEVMANPRVYGLYAGVDPASGYITWTMPDLSKITINGA